MDNSNELIKTALNSAYLAGKKEGLTIAYTYLKSLENKTVTLEYILQVINSMLNYG